MAQLEVAAACAGFALANASVGVPLQVLAQRHSPATAGTLLAAITGATALGAAISPPLLARLGGAPTLLTLALVLVASGHVMLTVGLATAQLAAGAAFVGLGIGVFWVSSQALLGALSGSPGSERQFLRHYAFFTAGTVAGSAVTGLAATFLQLARVSETTSLQLALGSGAVAAIVGLHVWRPDAHHADVPPPQRARDRRFAARGLGVQLPDLLLVAALSVLSLLTPIVLKTTFEFSSLGVGVVMAAIGVAKIAGTLAARALVTARGSASTIVGMVGAGAGLCLLLTMATTAWSFIPLVLAAVLVLAGAWPLVVDACHARTAHAGRGAFAVAWNIREYGVIAVASAGASWLYSQAHDTAPMFALGGVLLVGAVMSAGAMMRKPVCAPTS